MYLKRLEIQGFKSFADKIVLDYNSGITAVIGPNGSGKSNVADAVRWVLGEQSAKTLRGSKMEDVIFAGTEHRKPMGFAEVSLTIENGDNVLPVEYSEVTVTRRVYRSGEGEYFINKTQCRLKDINELFLDTGIGKDGYSIIGQGRVDEILSTKSEDRRQIFEEASGIMKYKVRKLEAEKKLDLTKQNLLRINDIIAELEGQIEPLRNQSETARKFLAIRENLKELEINVYIENIGRSKEKIKEFEEHYITIKESIDVENKRLEDITSANKQKTDLLREYEEKVNALKEEYYAIEGSLEKSNSEININNEREKNLSVNNERIDGEIAEINSKVLELENELVIKVSKLENLEEQMTNYSKKLQDSDKQMAEVLSSLNDTEKYIEKIKSDIMDKMDLMSDKKIQMNNEKSHIEGIQKRQSSIDSEVLELQLEKDRENLKKDELTKNLESTRASIKNAKEKLKAFDVEKNSLKTRLNDEIKALNALRSEIQIKLSRKKMLEDMEKNLEGYNRSVKMVLQACQQSPELGKGIHGALAQLIHVKQKYEMAIEMALGGALQNIVTTSEEDAKKAIEFLKRNKLGRATFLPISSVKGRAFDGNVINDLKREQGFIGVAADLLEFEKQYSGIVLSFLGRVAVVDNMDAGIRIARKFGYTFRIVTLEGDILNAGGSMAGGSNDTKGPSILSRGREISDIQADTERLKEKEVSTDRTIGEVNSRLLDIESKLAEEEKALKDNELVAVRDESHLVQVEDNIKRIEAKYNMLTVEKTQLVREIDGVQNDLNKYTKELADIEDDINQKKTIVSDHQEKQKEEQTYRDSLHTEVTDLKISVNSVKESMASVKDAQRRIDSDKLSFAKNLERRNAEKLKNNEEIQELNKINEDIRKLIQELVDKKNQKNIQFETASKEKKTLEEELFDIVHQINDINKNILLMQEEYNRIEVRKAKMESEMDSIQNRMWDEYELTYNNAMEFKKDIGGIPQAQKKINEYKSQIRELGPVNVASIDEYVKTKERFEFMSAQRDDMVKAEEKLQRVITEMTSIMKKQFMEQFKLINYNFGIVFKELFEGGRAELKLVDMENILESGIDIEVQPPGKKLQNMMLLSGGERAFTAIALLFSILRLRPTPFCILDEIEAALDDANVYRFAQYLKRFVSQTQFIMVTHRKGTMEAADTLYGVTMQEHGISKIVSMKLGDKAS